MGGLQGNNSSVTEESSCRKMASYEHYMSDECLDVLPNSTAHLWQSHEFPITVSDPGVPDPQALVHILKAHWPHKTAQIFVNCHFPVISLPCLVIRWSSVSCKIDSPLIYTTVSPKVCWWFPCPAGVLPCSTSPPPAEWILYVLSTCSSPEDVFAKILSAPVSLQKL